MSSASQTVAVSLLRTAAALLCAAASVASAQTNAGATAAHLTIATNEAVRPVSPTLYGLMTEEINHSYDGGLYAELLHNRTFRGNWEGVGNWYLVQQGASSASAEIDKTAGPSA